MKKLLITTAALASLWLLPTACGNDDDGTTPPPTDPDSPEAPIEGYSLYWAEEFDSDDLNPLNWNVETGVAANQELQYYTDRSENLRVEDGCLVIEARKEPMENREYTSARINTQGKVQIKYGYIEARIWLPAGQGTWPAFWMMGHRCLVVAPLRRDRHHGARRQNARTGDPRPAYAECQRQQRTKLERLDSPG